MHVTINNYKIYAYEDKYEVCDTSTGEILGYYDSLMPAIEAANKLSKEAKHDKNN